MLSQFGRISNAQRYCGGLESILEKEKSVYKGPKVLLGHSYVQRIVNNSVRPVRGGMNEVQSGRRFWSPDSP